MLLALVLYGSSSVFHMLALSRVWPGAMRVAKPLLAAAALAHLLAIGHQHLGGFPPPVDAPPSWMNLGVFIAVTVFVVADLFARTRILGAFVATVALMVLVTLFNQAGVEHTAGRLTFMRFVTPVHIATSAIGFLCFLVSFVSSTLTIIADQRLRERRGQGWPPLPPVSRLEEWSAGAVRIGFPFYTLGIILGTVWSYWGGDGGAMLLPEYLLGVGVWVLYAVIVLLSATTGWRGRRSAVLTVVGFLSTLPMMVMYVLRRLG
jgi:ABC-type uncharacterized transport system permease subunit